MKVSGKIGNGPVNKWLNFGGDPDHRLGTGIVFRIRLYWEIRKVVSTDCAAQRCSARHALVGIAVATVTSLRYRPTTDSHDGRALAEVCTVPVLLVRHAVALQYVAKNPTLKCLSRRKVNFTESQREAVDTVSRLCYLQKILSTRLFLP